MTDGVTGNAKHLDDAIFAYGVYDGSDSGFGHAADIANLFSSRQANNDESRQEIWHDTMPGMETCVHPFADIAARMKWHRETLGLSQEDYAATFGFKRSTYSLWEAGSHRLSLDGALALRKRYGLSLDFMYEGIDDALPMTLRNAWRDRP